jgi:hypothetical protein
MAVKTKTLVLLSLPVVWGVCVLAAAGALLVFGKGFTELGTLGVASVGMGTGLALLLFILVGVPYLILSGQGDNMARALPGLESYLHRWRVDGTFGPPRKELGLTWRYRGRMRGIDIYADFAATELRFPPTRYDLSAVQQRFRITCLCVAARMPARDAARTICQSMEQRFPSLSFVSLPGSDWVYLNRHIEVTGPQGEVVFPSERMGELLETFTQVVGESAGRVR